MHKLARSFVAFSSIIGGVIALLSGDLPLVGAAILLAIFGTFVVSLLLVPGILILGAVMSRFEPKTLNSTSGPGIWIAVALGTLHSSIIQVVWVIGCGLILLRATDGKTPPWAFGLLLVGASYGVWEWLAWKDLQSGNASSSIQLAHYALGLMLLYITLLLAPGAVGLALVLLLGAQLSAIPRIVDLEKATEAGGRLAAAEWDATA